VRGFAVAAKAVRRLAHLLIN